MRVNWAILLILGIGGCTQYQPVGWDGHGSWAAARAAANLAAAPGILAEQHSMAELTGRPTSSTYLGATDLLVDAALQRAREHLEGSQ